MHQYYKFHIPTSFPVFLLFIPTLSLCHLPVPFVLKLSMLSPKFYFVSREKYKTEKQMTPKTLQSLLGEAVWVCKFNIGQYLWPCLCLCPPRPAPDKEDTKCQSLNLRQHILYLCIHCKKKTSTLHCCPILQLIPARGWQYHLKYIEKNLIELFTKCALSQ